MQLIVRLYKCNMCKMFWYVTFNLAEISIEWLAELTSVLDDYIW